MKSLIALVVLTLGVTFGVSAQEIGMKSATTSVSDAAASNIVEIAVGSKDHSTLVAAVKAAGLVETLTGPGPFTVFAPVNSAFDKLPAGTVETLLKPENKGTLTGVLTYHVVGARLTYNDLRNQIKAGGGKAAAPLARQVLMAMIEADLLTPRRGLAPSRSK